MLTDHIFWMTIAGMLFGGLIGFFAGLIAFFPHRLKSGDRR